MEKWYLVGLITQRPLVRIQLPLQNPDGGLAQLARAPALHAGGQRFDSVILHNI